MRNIEELTKNVKKYKKAVLQQIFKSKKNTVAYVTLDEKPRVLKWFVPGLKQNMEKEYSILKNASPDLNIPFPYEIDKKNNVLILSYLTGENLCDLINSENIAFNEKKRLLILLAKWYNTFHNHFKSDNKFIIHGDSNLRNFIFSDKIWGVDLEESRNGSPVEDIAGMCSSILTTDPLFTPEKYKLCRIFIDSYVNLAPGRILNINDEIAYCLLEKIQWRPDKEDIFRKFSQQIREKGLL